MANDKKLWDEFSRFIRLRDSDENGYCKCFTCGRILFWRKGDAGHGMGRQHFATKYDERNNHFQCKHCNGFQGGMRERYKIEVNKRYGPQTWDLLELKSRSVSKVGQFEIDALTIHYRNLANELLKKKGLN